MTHIRHPYYRTRCEHCAWAGSSEDCIVQPIGDTGDSDVICPSCVRRFECDEVKWTAQECLDEVEAGKHFRAEECTCTPEGGCGEADEAGCCFCLHRDIYLPCPVIGYGCGLTADEPCDCCEPEQFRAARRGGLRVVR